MLGSAGVQRGPSIMAASTPKQVRCAIYTRKSTEHGLELEFNSLDAQREACEAYVRSQASQGWRVMARQYDDAAFSGGNLERPALRDLLGDIAAGKVDVVVVYKIDRLTRSLTDFAKLVELFDAHAVSFVAVTQQFNTTSSMGRLTLNVLLSFAQFERELSSERVRDKIAASRRKGRWTGGTVPLGYDAIDKNLMINPAEAETVRTIFSLYLEHKNYGRVIAELARRRIITKQRMTKNPRYNGGIAFRYGPLVHLLKNRIYIGEVHHDGKWYAGEHEPLLDRNLFDQAQALMPNLPPRRQVRSESGALLIGRLYDDRGNRMSPSFTNKNGVRYQFYVSSALLRGRKGECGTVGRIAARTIEDLVLTAVRPPHRSPLNSGDDPFPSRLCAAPAPSETMTDSDLIAGVERIVITATELRIALSSDQRSDEGLGIPPTETLPTVITIPWTGRPDSSAACLEPTPTVPDPALIHVIVRARLWVQMLETGEHDSVEILAEVAGLHPKVVRQSLRLAFLPPDITAAILEGRQPRSLSARAIPQTLPLGWRKQRKLLLGPTDA